MSAVAAGPERGWCYTCERWHQPMEWGEGCTDDSDVKVGAHVGHYHATFRRSDTRAQHHEPGAVDVPEPARVFPWWRRWRGEWQCRRLFNHCWHPYRNHLIDWFCCMCGRIEDGLPPDRCVVCQVNREIDRLGPGRIQGSGG